MAVRSIRLIGVPSLLLLLTLSLSTTTKPGAWAFVTPVKRASVGTGIGFNQKESSPFSLAMTSKKTKTLIRPEKSLAEDDGDDNNISTSQAKKNNEALSVMVAATSTTIMGLAALSETANAMSSITMPKELTQSFDPSSFVPVCAASDGFYRFLQSTAQTVVGRENFVEYGPLIASGLLRVRLELCVVESFFNEAVGPFINQNGLSWVLPLHETVETFLAGTVFALATTFILVGSTKILTVIFTYADFFVGGPLRIFGGFFFDRARGKPVIVDVGLGPFKTRVIGPKDDEEDEKKNSKFDYAVDFGSLSGAEVPVVVVSGGVKFAGQAIGAVREVLDAIDLFVGKSLILW
eukprot:CAMPEP_0168295636 /NCGR_PEP_ID=MMETSP0142_2-20121227/13053_1 /TAXON_ID=44445 /ORGANISM="Pseudo-nitzschia australis, Strain 10249 10 AB" /LENGTH=349 /DNA_ID=CAMNT_0008244381 /DNA_START=121 /DNA_END=1167 /DNA_ORIENTATION=+